MTTEHNEFADVAQIYMESLEANGVNLPSDKDMKRYRAAIAAEHEKMDAEDDSLRATYAVDLTNGEDQQHIAALSYTSGRYGFGVIARSMEEAVTKVADRAMRDGFYDCGWSAQITRLWHAGASMMASWNPFDPQSQRIVALGGAEEANQDTWRAAWQAAQDGRSAADAADATRTPQSDILDRATLARLPRSVGAR